jgi:hypothetical protein
VAIPVLILPLLSAAYAEVNVEGKRLLKVATAYALSSSLNLIKIRFSMASVHLPDGGTLSGPVLHVPIASANDHFRSIHHVHNARNSFRRIAAGSGISRRPQTTGSHKCLILPEHSVAEQFEFSPIIMFVFSQRTLELFTMRFDSIATELVA